MDENTLNDSYQGPTLLQRIRGALSQNTLVRKTAIPAAMSLALLYTAPGCDDGPAPDGDGDADIDGDADGDSDADNPFGDIDGSSVEPQPDFVWNLTQARILTFEAPSYSGSEDVTATITVEGDAVGDSVVEVVNESTEPGATVVGGFDPSTLSAGSLLPGGITIRYAVGDGTFSRETTSTGIVQGEVPEFRIPYCTITANVSDGGLGHIDCPTFDRDDHVIPPDSCEATSPTLSGGLGCDSGAIFTNDALQDSHNGTHVVTYRANIDGDEIEYSFPYVVEDMHASVTIRTASGERTIYGTVAEVSRWAEAADVGFDASDLSDLSETYEVNHTDGSDGQERTDAAIAGIAAAMASASSGEDDECRNFPGAQGERPYAQLESLVGETPAAGDGRMVQFRFYER